MQIHKLAHLVFFTSVAIGFAQGPASPAASSPKPHANDIQRVEGDVAIIEEATLLPFAGFGPQKVEAGDVLIVPDSAEDAVTAMRCYGFMLAPGEKLQVRLKTNSSSRMVMRFVPRPTPDAMTSQVRKANLPPRPIRSTRIEIQNITREPYQVNLALSGHPNYPYKMEIQRKLN